MFWSDPDPDPGVSVVFESRLRSDPDPVFEIWSDPDLIIMICSYPNPVLKIWWDPV